MGQSAGEIAALSFCALSTEAPTRLLLDCEIGTGPRSDASPIMSELVNREIKRRAINDAPL